MSQDQPILEPLKCDWEPPEEKLPYNKAEINNRKRLSMKAIRIVRTRYGDDVMETKPRSEYKALIAAAKLEILASEKTADPRLEKPRLVKRAEEMHAKSVGTIAEPKGHKERKKLTINVKQSIMETFNNMGGVEGYTRWAERNPDKFYEHWAKLLPIEMKATMEVNTNISTILQQARLRVSNLREVKGERLDGDTGGGRVRSSVADLVDDAEGVISEQ